jgi:arginine decarboxylase-like protein
MGKRIFIVVEKLNELKLIRDVSRALNVKPNIGMRVKLASSGSGKWEESGGDQSKFGLNSSELLEAVEFAKQEGMEHCLKLIHFHLGSQITNIRKIKSGLREAAQFYVQLRKMGVPVEFVDVGGGLGVDYDGTRSANANSVNYSIQEYANAVVYSMVSAADKAGQEFGFQAKAFNVYPIKVNQQRPVLEEMVRHGKKFNIGLEAGSKPELHAVLSIMDNPESLIICNGYKDEEFIELALLAQKMGKRIFIVVEKLNELKLIRDV